MAFGRTCPCAARRSGGWPDRVHFQRVVAPSRASLGRTTIRIQADSGRVDDCVRLVFVEAVAFEFFAQFTGPAFVGDVDLERCGPASSGGSLHQDVEALVVVGSAEQVLDRPVSGDTTSVSRANGWQDGIVTPLSSGFRHWGRSGARHFADAFP
ncbi:hypothetical protein CKO28_13430 [Rhodovibrio sodomensis]|uniref:Uncharacterized protein n=1 Tax=Rhodovibrio sodomensis TaxID=1088 RepID=A0ABS1DGR7_9PROT|nr:hypothetical protein [Rhodovibrio sodomensis]